MLFKENLNLSSIVDLQGFTIFPEYFIAISIIYVLIVVVLVSYNVYNLMLQKAISHCLALVLIMACYLILNDDLINKHFLSFHNLIINDHLAFVTKFIVCFSSSVYFLIIADSLAEQKLTSFEFLLLILFAVLGLVLLCSSYSLLTAYLAIELSSLSFYMLASFRKTSTYSVESGIKYFIIGSISSAFFLLGSSLVYGSTGTINILDLYELIEERYLDPFDFIISYLISLTGLYPMKYTFIAIDYDTTILELGVTLILFSFFIKLALAPFHLWSLDVYEGSPTSSTFFFAVIGKLSIFVFLVRFCYESLALTLEDTYQFYFMWIAVFSIFVGSFGGLRQRKLKTLLAYSSTSHMGYALLSLSTLTSLGIQMLFFYLVIYIIAGLCTWGIVLSLRLKASKTNNKYSKELGDLVLLNKSNPSLAFVFAITMFSIAGIPPMIGFLAKMNIFIPVVNISYYSIAVISILCSVISTFYYIRIVKILYFENTIVGKLYYPLNYSKALILSLLAFLLIFLFIKPNLLYLIFYKTIFIYNHGTTNMSFEFFKVYMYVVFNPLFDGVPFEDAFQNEILD
jgi:NADH-quinone oxidoreductase subunit N